MEFNVSAYLHNLCVRCHRKKTISEIKVIHVMKNLGFIRSSLRGYMFLLEEERIKELFKQLLYMKEEADKCYERYENE